MAMKAKNGAVFHSVCPRVNFLLPIGMEKIRQIVTELEMLETQHGRLVWTMYTNGFDFGVQEAKQKVSDFFKNKSHYKIICDFLEKDLEPKEKREVEVLHREFKQYHLSEKANQLKEKIQTLEVKLNDILNKHRAVLAGHEVSSVEIKKRMDSDNQVQRKEAFLAQTQVNKKLVDGGFLELIRLRKEYAEACGAKDFVSLRLEDDELPAEIFQTWRDECSKRSTKRLTKEKEWASEYLKQEKLEPWDTSYIANKMCSFMSEKVNAVDFLSPMSKVYDSYGFDLKNADISYDLFPRKNKSEWGYFFNIEAGKDARILANMDDEFKGFWVLMHEAGHGIHYLGLDPENKILNRAVSGIVAEGFANFFGDLTYSKEFLAQFFKDNLKQVCDRFNAFQKFNGLQVFNHLQSTLFDQELYRKDLNSLNDIHELNWSLRKELLGSEPYGDEPVWGMRVHHTNYPIYLHNYFLGDVMSANLKKVFEKRTGQKSEDNPLAFGQLWKEKVLGPSGRYSFLDLYKKVCEEDLSLSSYLDDCVS